LLLAEPAERTRALTLLTEGLPSLSERERSVLRPILEKAGLSFDAGW
jgi:hypothetical protein